MASKRNSFEVLIHIPLEGEVESQILKQRPKLKYSLPLRTEVSLFPESHPGPHIKFMVK